MKKNIIIYVGGISGSAVRSVRSYAESSGNDLRIMLLREQKLKKQPVKADVDIVAHCDFSSPKSIAEALLPYQDELLALTCRADASIARFAAVIPHVPYLRTPSTESLAWSTDKYEMRKRLKLFDPKHTPRFTLIKNNTKQERQKVIDKVKFPLVIKPTNLAASTLVSICYHEEELEKTLRVAFRKLKVLYEKNNRTEVPRLMAEEYMEGDMYSLDAYVNTRGELYFCPLVKVITGKNKGHDDFYNYLRITPVKLKKTSIETAQDRVTKAVHALGLHNVTVHVELIRTDDEWRIIEVNPRIGGFRHILHNLSCDIDHSLNDILIRLPKKPIIPKKCKGFAAAMRYYPDQEGKVLQINGLKKIKELPSFHSIRMRSKVGERSYFSKNGGKGIFDVTLYNEDRAKLLADIRRIEQAVKVVIGRKNGATQTKNKLTKVVTKKQVTKKTKK